MLSSTIQMVVPIWIQQHKQFMVHH
jgi:hypothetical protein